ncbi:immune inhibitor A domain-containing protein [Streptomyces sp. HM190]|uniref:immune inhibitor A domain-containing protein n=1 Tax=Streptomyces sp. HM190 TaxID=2695266 RepID=UPI00135A1EE6|nr:immune inhibitor A domain-containing protein [Streptomyces sp. HM190]
MSSKPWTFRAAATSVVLATAAATFTTFTVVTPRTAAAHTPPAATDHDHPADARAAHEHDLETPLSRTRAAQREEALTQLISGDATVKNRDGSQVVQLKSRKGDPKYVELGREKTDRIFTVLVEFGDRTDDRYGGTPGPLHNKIAKPDRKKNNTTAWRADYDREHYERLLFGTGKKTESMKKYYEKQSSGRYSIEGTVSDWVKVPYNEARYGSNKCRPDTCAWQVVADGVTAWAEQRKAAGRTDAEIKAELASFDTWDRGDFDGDGDFNEPDGYIDHFQLVHAGEGEEAGGGPQGEDAIWSHRWYAFSDGWDKTGPEGNKRGGAPVGDTGIWVGDYTIMPENGGLGVFAHEYGHDLGLPDHYDTTGNGDNSTGFWTLMSGGSWLGRSSTEIGELPGDMTAWDKLQLGWLNYDRARAGKKSAHTLGVAEYNTRDKQALVVELPRKRVKVEVVKPVDGTRQWWSGSADSLSSTLTRSVDLTGKTSAALTLDGWWDIEKEYDFLYTEVSTDGGATWTAVDGTADGGPISRDGGGTPALDGTTDGFRKLSYSLDAYAGKKIDLRFRYQTDKYVAQKGFVADRITVTADGSPLFSDDAETADPAWTAAGFSRFGGSYTTEHEQYYIAENRQYVSYDQSLRSAYSFTRSDWVERYPYQNGLLIWKWDTSQQDNNTSQHPGTGLLLPVDARPKGLKWSDGERAGNSLQTHDSTFTLGRTDAFTLHRGKKVTLKVTSRKGVPEFNDRTHTYYDKSNNPTGSVKITNTNTRIRIVKEAKDGSTVMIRVEPAGK